MTSTTFRGLRTSVWLACLWLNCRPGRAWQCARLLGKIYAPAFAFVEKSVFRRIVHKSCLYKEHYGVGKRQET